MSSNANYCPVKSKSCELQQQIVNTPLKKTNTFPILSERILQLNPSKELIDYYRKRLSSEDVNHEELINKLEQYKKNFEQESIWISEIKIRDDAISDLQKALSDMQIFLFQERQQTLKLLVENRKFKMQEKEDERKSQEDIICHSKEPLDKSLMIDKHKKLPNKSNFQAKESNLSKNFNQIERLKMTIEVLEHQLDEQNKLHKDEMEALVDDRKLRIQEIESQKQKDAHTIQYLNQKSKILHQQLFESTRDFLQYRNESREAEHRWLIEQERLLKELQFYRSKVSELSSGKAHLKRPVATNIHSVQWQLEQTQSLSDMYREQCIKLEDELSQLKEESSSNKSLFKTRFEKLNQRLNSTKLNYQDLEKRRNLEMEGFKIDIKNLNGKLTDLEKTIYKIMLNLEMPDRDKIFLQKFYQTLNRTKNIHGEVKDIKTKIYSLENALRHS